MAGLEAFNRTLFLHINGGDGTPTRLVRVATGMADDLILPGVCSRNGKKNRTPGFCEPHGRLPRQTNIGYS